MMLSVDDELNEKEKTWFTRISKSYGVPEKEQIVLLEYLNGHHSESLENLVAQIDDGEDKMRLLRFVKLAAEIDGVVKNREIALFNEIKSAFERQVSSDDYLDLGRSLLQRDQEIQMWQELDSLGKSLSKRYYWSGFSTYSYQIGTGFVIGNLFALALQYKHKRIALFLLVVLVGLIFLKLS